MRRLPFLVCFLVFSFGKPDIGHGQIWKKIIPEREKQTVEDNTIKQLRLDVNYLASDQLEGRRAGSKGEALAGVYIERRMKDAGILPIQGSYRRPFKFEAGRELSPETKISINDKYLNVPEEAFPLPFSGVGLDENFVMPESMEANAPWLIELYENEKEAADAHFDAMKVCREKARYAIDRGATSVLFYDKYGSKYAPKYENKIDHEALGAPVFFLTKSVYDKQIASIRVMQPLYLNMVYKKEFRTGTNIVGYIDNGAINTVIIGAHYDHLGYGEDGNSRYVGGGKEIHNGADDNASGVAVLLGLAKRIKDAGLKNYNYLFIAFSAEELGLLGSKAFLNEKVYPKGKVAYMVNLDMVGRLDTARKLMVGGVGTSPSWAGAFASVKGNFKIVKDSSGVGPSDHTSFYNDGVPVLFFFTGTHSDYHTPGDDAHKVNFGGARDILNYVYDICAFMEKQPKPAFLATKNNAMGSRTAFKVTLGIMPDYSYKEQGIKVDGVIQGKPADKAGLLQGDVILQLGEVKINGMETYMEALGRFEPGTRTTVKVKRGSATLELPIVL